MFPRDNIVDGLRAMAWFYWIAKRIGSERPIDVRRAIEGEGAGISKDGHPDLNSKFSLYKSGKRCPGGALIAKAEEVLPGSRLVITHPLWKILSARQGIAGAAVKLVRELHPDIQQWLLASRGAQIKLTSIGLSELAKLATVDSLAALLVFFRLAHERDESRFKWDCAEAICKTLLVLGPVFEMLRIEEKIFDVFAHRFLYLAVHDGYARVWTTYDYASIAAGLDELARARKEITKKRHSIKYFALQILRSLPKDEDFLPVVYPYLNFGPPTLRGSQLMAIFNNRSREEKKIFNQNDKTLD